MPLKLTVEYVSTVHVAVANGLPRKTATLRFSGWRILQPVTPAASATGCLLFSTHKIVQGSVLKTLKLIGERNITRGTTLLKLLEFSRKAILIWHKLRFPKYFASLKTFLCSSYK
jgi:hypothetical protein